MLIDLLIAISCAFAGLLCGWLAYPAMTKLEPQATLPPESSENEKERPAEDESSDNEEQARLSEIANRLSLLTSSVAASVHQHHSELQVANDLVRTAKSKHDSATLLQAMNRLLDASEMMRDQLTSAEQKLVEQNQLLQMAQHRSLVDPLTQVANRRALDAHLEGRVALLDTSPSTLMMIDIDHFKHFNDTYGHLAGDAVLRSVAALLREKTISNGFVARYGGEEFVVVLNDVNMNQCIQDAEKIRLAIAAEQFCFDGRKFEITASMGVAELSRQTCGTPSPESWLRDADQALYASKTLRNCTHAMLNGIAVRVHNDADIRQLANNQDRARHANTQKITATPRPPAIDQAELPHALKGLPTGQKLIDQFSALASGLNGVGFAFVTAVVRIKNTTSTLEDLQTISRAIRSVVRSVDRIGILDQRTLIVAMPNIDHETALQKADRIRASLVFSTGAHFDSSAHQLQTSVALCSNCEKPTFPEMLRTSLRLLDKQDTGTQSQTLKAW